MLSKHPHEPWRVHSVFDGQILVRESLLGNHLQFLDGKSLGVLGELFLYARDGQICWILTSPDGRWDGSPGTEEFLAIYRSGGLEPGAKTGRKQVAGRRRID